jgi:hypothetical protein
MTENKIEKVLQEHSIDLMKILGVVGVGQGLCNKQPCIKVYVVKKVSELMDKIPKKLEGYSVQIKETGIIRALSENRH